MQYLFICKISIRLLANKLNLISKYKLKHYLKNNSNSVYKDIYLLFPVRIIYLTSFELCFIKKQQLS